MERDEERKKNDHERWATGRGVAQCHLDKLKAEKAEYEKLISHDSQTPIVLELDDIDYLPDILIKARIAAKLSEKELGALCGCTEEQIKRYEKDDYQSASYLDFKREIFPSNQPVGSYSITSYELFQRDRSLNKKGIIAIDLLRWKP